MQHLETDEILTVGKRLTKYIVVCIGLLICIQSGIAIYGWMRYHNDLPNIFPIFFVMGYKPAFCFYLTGISLVVLTLENKFSYSSLVASVIVIFMTIYPAIESLFSITIPVYKMLFIHYMTEANFEQISPNSALNFLLANVALIMMNTGRPHHYHVIWANFLGLIIFIAGSLFAIGYLIGMQQIYQRYDILAVGLNSAILFILFGISIIATAWYKSIKLHIDIIKTLPFNVFICFTIGTVLYWYVLHSLSIAAGSYSHVPEIMFAIGLAFTILITFTLYFAIASYETSQKRAKLLSLLNATLESTTDGIISINKKGEVLVYNTNFLKMWELTNTSEILKGTNLLTTLADRCQDTQKFIEKIDDLHRYLDVNGYYELTLKNDKIFECYSQPEYIEKSVIGRVWCFRDVTDNRRMQAQIIHQTTYDPLTSLPNRLLLSDRLTQAIMLAKKDNLMVATLLVDIDKFKLINDSFGHQLGDQLLKQFAQRLKGIVKTNDTVSHFSGDTFALVIANIKIIEDCIHVINECGQITAKSFQLTGQDIPLSCSIGISLYPKDGQDAETLIKNADAALQNAKSHSFGKFQFFTEEMSLLINERIMFGNEIRRAINERQFYLDYQPIFNLKTGEIDAVECLMRWKHPTEGLIPPTKFIRLAEENNLIDVLGEAAILNAATTIKKFQNMNLKPIRFCVNLSTPQLNQSKIALIIKNILEKAQIASSLLEIELTENILLEATRTSIEKLYEITQSGVTLSIDDFGTGYSSLRYLQEFPFSALKIDHSFVKNISNENRRGAAIVEAIVSMAQVLNLRIIAEGIENRQELDFLVKLHCAKVINR